ncbi:hypothetical protein [Streptomyces sp. NPDC059949]|uniref:hypothetical protein n=1 Tax=Streptomyces sp. NPDC059949 TaxID=3347013 RepID=UPI00364E1C65
MVQAGLDHAELLLRASEEPAQTSGWRTSDDSCGTCSSASGTSYVGLLVAGYSPEAVGFFDRMGFTTVLRLPLWGSRALLGVLAICWAKRHEVGVTERATLTAASGYIAQTVERALYLDERISVAPVRRPNCSAGSVADRRTRPPRRRRGGAGRTRSLRALPVVGGHRGDMTRMIPVALGIEIPIRKSTISRMTPRRRITSFILA